MNEWCCSFVWPPLYKSIKMFQQSLHQLWFLTELKDNILCTRSNLCDLTELLKLKIEMDKKQGQENHEKLNCAVKHLVEQVDIFQQICIRELKSNTENLWNINQYILSTYPKIAFSLDT